MATIMIKVPSTKIEGLSEDLEKGLRYLGKAMQCIDALKTEQMGEGMGAREGGMGMRGYDYKYPVQEREGIEAEGARMVMGDRRNPYGRYY